MHSCSSKVTNLCTSGLTGVWAPRHELTETVVQRVLACGVCGVSEHGPSSRGARRGELGAATHLTGLRWLEVSLVIGGAVERDVFRGV